MSRFSALRIAPAVLLAGGALTACLPEGHLDSAKVEVTVDGSTIRVSGWAWDQDAPTTPIDVHVYVDTQGMPVRADLYRPDVALARPAAGPYHGYEAVMRADAGTHQVCAYGINAPGTEGGNALLGCKIVTVDPAPLTQAPAPTTPTTQGSGSPTTTTTAPPPPAPLTWQADVLARVNAQRSAAGVGPLSRCARLDTAAQSYAATMAGQAWLDHTGPDGSQPWERIGGYGGSASGENLAFGFDGPAAFVQGMMASPSERENLLRPEFTHLGTGRTMGDPDGAGPTAASYYWVQELGTGGTC